MKKTILSFLLFLAFSGYVLYTRILGVNTPVVITPDPSKAKVPISLPVYTPQPIPPVDTTKTPTPPPPKPVGKYKDGSYTGNSINAYYGNVKVMAIISGGKIVDVQFLDHPQDRQTSVYINNRAMPYLISEAIVAQDSKVDAVSGASFTSAAFVKSLGTALAKAKV